MEDLKVQGKRELQSLIKWRIKLLKVLKKEQKTKGVEEEKQADDGNGTDSELEEEIKKEKQRELVNLRRERVQMIILSSKLIISLGKEDQSND